MGGKGKSNRKSVDGAENVPPSARGDGDSASKLKKGKKSKKLEGQPKRPQSAYFMWLNEAGRKQIKEENPGISVTEVGKKSGQIWKEMTAEDKAEWEEKAKVAKAEYDEVYKTWLAEGGAEAIKQQKKEKKANKGRAVAKPKQKKEVIKTKSTGEEEKMDADDESEIVDLETEEEETEQDESKTEEEQTEEDEEEEEETEEDEEEEEEGEPEQESKKIKLEKNGLIDDSDDDE